MEMCAMQLSDCVHCVAQLHYRYAIGLVM